LETTNNPPTPTTKYIDGTGQIVGRLASYVAKEILNGKRITVVNCQNLLFSGTKGGVVSDWMSTLEIGSVGNPKHGPFHPRTPDRIFARVVRGMLPRRKPKGMKALKRLRTFVGFPENLSKSNGIIIDSAKATKPIPYYVTLGDVAKRLGWKEG
jgi:large subunit ribosomal protein L13